MGTIVDATIISAPSLTKKDKRERDLEMHQTQKGQQWFFGLQRHIGVDSKTGLAHSAVVTAANVHDKHAIPQLLRGAELEAGPLPASLDIRHRRALQRACSLH